MILLLAAAVILPTVCLVWFMNQAVQNVQLAARSKLSSVYRGEIDRAFGPFLDWLNSDNPSAQTALLDNDAYGAFRALAADNNFESEALLIYNETAEQITYPFLWDETDALDNRPELQEAIRLEFVEQSPRAAIAEYERIAKAHPDSLLYKRCKLGQARNLEKMGELEMAIAMCETVQREPLDDSANWSLYTMANLKILDLLRKQGVSHKKQIERFSDRIGNLLQVIDTIKYVPCDQRVLAYDKIRSIPEDYSDWMSRKVRNHLSGLGNRMAIERASMHFMLNHPDVATHLQTDQQVVRFADSGVYAVKTRCGTFDAIRIVDLDTRIQQLGGTLSFSDDIHWRILNGSGAVVTGLPSLSRSAFLTLPLTGLADWTVEFYETGETANVFEAAARRQSTIYIWTGILVIGFILATGTVAIRSVNHQIQVNRLKNDFIATVTHELKTPLASMRLLVDTLLAKRVPTQETTDEYLQMISQENKRLTHLIDSFLTFSRMERNKQVFDFQSIRPETVAAEAAEAMQAKLNGDECLFSTSAEANLPPVYADKDAMVTVLVNLLDNAWKYTNGHKRIELNVYARDEAICFSVKDNGIGLNPRLRKKIFNRFYQVDSRLSRQTEGCGLGLSIVKFIVDAHHGHVDVQSSPCEGSVFTVKLPVGSSSKNNG